VVLMGPAGYMGRVFTLALPEQLIGRSVDCQLYIDDLSVSRNHAKVVIEGPQVLISDLGSSNKTLVNGQMLSPMTTYQLKHNDQVKAGNVIFKFLEKGNLETATTKELIDKAQKDALTGAYSKGALLEKGPEAVKRSEFLNEELGLLVFDLDHFKKINDTYGHDCGDYVLKSVGFIVSSKMVRSNDFFARYGGEEFVILLPGASIKTALEVGERIRATIESFEFTWKSQRVPVTVSVGVGARKPTELDWKDLFTRADKALYSSKQSGRNRVTPAT